jgi:hypothetical protein
MRALDLLDGHSKSESGAKDTRIHRRYLKSEDRLRRTVIRKTENGRLLHLPL